MARFARSASSRTFQLTRPLRGATNDLEIGEPINRISTHTPLAGRDRKYVTAKWGATPFQLTRPLRGATAACYACRFNEKFQLTRPLRGATADVIAVFRKECISTHTPLAGRDNFKLGAKPSAMNFNSHAPCGARHQPLTTLTDYLGFQLTRPLRGAT